MDIRRNQATLSQPQRQAFVQAILALKQRPSRIGPSIPSRYDDYVWIHLRSMDTMTDTQPGWAHSGPAFLPWHRYFLRQLELDLQMIDPSVTLPYWDWTVDQSPDPTVPGSPWSDDLMGGDGDPNQNWQVTTGLFAGAAGNYVLNLFDDGEFQDANLRRHFASFPQVSQLPTADQVADCLKELPFYVAPWRAFPNLTSSPRGTPAQPSFSNRLEGWYGLGSIHNRVHLWVGGGTPPTFSDAGSMFWNSSPNDPVFFLHHCNIDRLWAQWQANFPNEGYHPTGEGSEVGPPGHNLNDPMQPWGGNVTPANMLDHHALGYSYDSEPAPEPLEMRDLFSALPQKAMAHPMPMGHIPFDLSPEDKAAN